MKAQVKKIDFSNQNIYCGVDVHKKRWQVTMCTEHTVQKSLSFERPFVDKLKSTAYPPLTTDSKMNSIRALRVIKPKIHLTEDMSTSPGRWFLWPEIR